MIVLPFFAQRLVLVGECSRLGRFGFDFADDCAGFASAKTCPPRSLERRIRSTLLRLAPHLQHGPPRLATSDNSSCPNSWSSTLHSVAIGSSLDQLPNVLWILTLIAYRAGQPNLYQSSCGGELGNSTVDMCVSVSPRILFSFCDPF